jgi:hypothetical protein
MGVFEGFTRDELAEAVVDLLALAAVARRRAGLTEKEIRALSPTIAVRANDLERTECPHCVGAAEILRAPVKEGFDA